MLKKKYGLFYKNGKWCIRNYGRVLKSGEGLSFLPAKYTAWNRNRTGETPIIELKRIVPQPGPPEDYLGPALEPGDLEASRELSPIKVSWYPTGWTPSIALEAISPLKGQEGQQVDSGVHPPQPMPENDTCPPQLEEIGQNK